MLIPLVCRARQIFSLDERSTSESAASPGFLKDRLTPVGLKTTNTFGNTALTLAGYEPEPFAILVIHHATKPSMRLKYIPYLNYRQIIMTSQKIEMP